MEDGDGEQPSKPALNSISWAEHRTIGRQVLRSGTRDRQRILAITAPELPAQCVIWLQRCYALRRGCLEPDHRELPGRLVKFLNAAASAARGTSCQALQGSSDRLVVVIASTEQIVAEKE
jgi:hypothetical protein